MKTDVRASWDEWFLARAFFNGLRSKDPSDSQVGAVIVRPDFTEVASGYAGFPRGLQDDARLGDPAFNHLIVHAELNAMHMCKESLQGYTLYTYNRFPCPNCFPHIAQRGFKRIVGPWPKENKWQHRTQETVNLCIEAGIEYSLINLPETTELKLIEAVKCLNTVRSVPFTMDQAFPTFDEGKLA